MSIEMPSLPIESEPQQDNLEAEKAAYAAKEALVTAAKGFESLAEAVTKIGPFESSGVSRTPEEIIAKLKALENAADQEAIVNIIKTIPRKFKIRDTVMDIMGLE